MMCTDRNLGITAAVVGGRGGGKRGGKGGGGRRGRRGKEMRSEMGREMGGMETGGVEGVAGVVVGKGG